VTQRPTCRSPTRTTWLEIGEMIQTWNIFSLFFTSVRYLKIRDFRRSTLTLKCQKLKFFCEKKFWKREKQLCVTVVRVRDVRRYRACSHGISGEKKIDENYSKSSNIKLAVSDQNNKITFNVIYTSRFYL